MAGAWFERFADVAAALHLSLALAARRHVARALRALGAVALFGLPGVVAPMPMLTNPVEYMNHAAPLYHDIQRSQPLIPGLSITQVWLKGSLGSVSEPEVLTGLDELPAGARERPGRRRGGRPDHDPAHDPLPRRRRATAGPTTPTAVEQVAGDLEGLVAQEPMLQRFVQPHELAQTQLTVITPRRQSTKASRGSTPPFAAIGRTRVTAHPALQAVRAADRRPGAAPRQDGAEPGADAGRELRADGGHHLRRVPASSSAAARRG